MHSKKLMLVFTILCLCGLTGCWDLVEINQLAIGNMVGGDIDPKTGNQIVYYQIVNPTAIASQRGTGIKSAVYTYRVEAPTIAELALKSSDTLPRDLFPDHYQSHVISERYARQGLRPFLNFLERQFNRRTDLYLIITDSPLSDVMNTYTLLERLPGRSLRSLIELQAKVSGRVSKKSRIKDLVENMETSRLTVLPIVTLQHSRHASTTERYEEINASRGNMMLSGGAIFKHDRMIGKLNLSQMPLYYLLKGETNAYYDTLTLHAKKVDVRATKIKVHKRLSVVSGKPVWKLDIHVLLQIMNDEQQQKLTPENLDEIKEAFNRQVSEKGRDFFEQAKSKGWDLFGLEEQMKIKRGKEWAEVLKQKDFWKNAKPEITVNSKITDIGEIIDPYKVKQ